MATKPGTPAASAATPPDGTIPEVTPTATPTITFYKQLADEFMRELDDIAPIIPQLEAAHISTVNFVRSHLNVPIKFLATAIAAVEQTPALQAVNKLDVLAARDTLQFIEAFRPVLDKVSAFASALKFTIASRKASRCGEFASDLRHRETVGPRSGQRRSRLGPNPEARSRQAWPSEACGSGCARPHRVSRPPSVG